MMLKDCWWIIVVNSERLNSSMAGMETTDKLVLSENISLIFDSR